MMATTFVCVLIVLMNLLMIKWWSMNHNGLVGKFPTTQRVGR
jgi:hypothetical protein